ncbi:MAG: flagellar assembly protein FliH [Wenzhouxiangella sp.]|jgi:flagellar assembly protein FliH|nr:flagellar assembly protein FliH [Wenzhouxiangella sp.]
MSEILSREWLDDVQTWQLPDVRRAGPVTTPKPPSRHQTIHSAAQLERLQKQAWEEAHAAGRREGLEKGLAEGRDEVKHQVRILKSMIQSLQQPLAAIDTNVEQELTELAVAIARHVIDDELRTDPERILQLVPRAVADLPVGSRDVRVRVHPDDARLLQEHLPDGDGEATWKLVEDASVQRGGCRVETPQSSIDATLEKRIEAVVGRVFRADDEDEPGSGS